jgi:hypothetical protein
MISSNRFALMSAVAGLLAAASLGYAQNQDLYIAQVADGGPPAIQDWQTTIVITNTSSAASSVTSMTFWQQTAADGTTAPWNLSFVEAPTFPLNVPAGTTILLHTTATATVTSAGWADIVAGPGIQAYAIFTAIGGSIYQDATGIAVPAATRFLVPFDQTNSAAVGLAIANTSNTSQTLNVAAKTASGTVIQSSPLTIPAQGHYNFSLAGNSVPAALSEIVAAITNQSGLMEIYTSSASLSVLTLRFNFTGAYTAAPVYAEAGPPIIGTATGSSAAPFSQLFVSGTWALSGTAGSPIIQITPNANGTYTAGVYELQPFILVDFPSGTLSGQTLTFNTIGSTGIFGTSAATSGSLTVTVNNFDQVGSPVTGTMSITNSSGTSSGTITGSSTYQP